MKSVTDNNVCGDQDFGWLDQRWFTGTPNERCHFCGLPQIFPPESLGIEICKCGVAISANKTSMLKVRFGRVQRFNVKINGKTHRHHQPVNFNPQFRAAFLRANGNPTSGFGGSHRVRTATALTPPCPPLTLSDFSPTPVAPEWKAKKHNQIKK
jgi:hypothetical protein